jgi:hypothetical protein
VVDPAIQVPVGFVARAVPLATLSPAVSCGAADALVAGLLAAT